MVASILPLQPQASALTTPSSAVHSYNKNSVSATPNKPEQSEESSTHSSYWHLHVDK